MINYSLGAKFNLSSFFSNHTVLRLPPYHCIFNPKENIWGIASFYSKHIGQENVALELTRGKTPYIPGVPSLASRRKMTPKPNYIYMKVL
jgi:hypothetical protein